MHSQGSGFAVNRANQGAAHRNRAPQGHHSASHVSHVSLCCVGPFVLNGLKRADLHFLYFKVMAKQHSCSDSMSMHDQTTSGSGGEKALASTFLNLLSNSAPLLFRLRIVCDTLSFRKFCDVHTCSVLSRLMNSSSVLAAHQSGAPAGVSVHYFRDATV